MTATNHSHDDAQHDANIRLEATHGSQPADCELHLRRGVRR